MVTHTSHPLSRAVSSVDLSAALLKTQKSPQEQRNSCEESLASQLQSFSPHDMERKDLVNVHQEETCCPKPPPPTPHDPTATDPAEIEANEPDNQIVPKYSEASEDKKKKKKKKSSGVNKKAKPTGFEEWYADPPLTPAEHKEESALYDESVPFYQRIELCMQKYRARRNLDSVRNNILTKYFMLGGIDATPRAFTGGLDKETIQTSTAEEIRAMTATDFIQSGNKKYYDPDEPENWIVDFEGVARGFFSERVPQLFCVDRQEDIKLYSSVIRNFLNYVLAHNVCPEYNDDVMAAREICNRAEHELWSCQLFRWAFPGDFNMAASTLYGGYYKGMHVSTQTWEQDDPENDKWNSLNPGMSLERAERIFNTAIAMRGDDHTFTKVRTGDVHVIKSEVKSLVVTGIVRASQASIGQYATIKDSDGVVGKLKALGVVIVKPWCGPGIDEIELSDDEEDSNSIGNIDSNARETELWLEDEILKHLFVGMKLELTLHELNIGITYFDTLGGPYCSFYLTMENEKMVDWKEPTPNTRPAPNEDNPNVEEEVFNAEIEDDIKDIEKIMISNNESQKSLADVEKQASTQN